jgi:hypothetical protein
VLGASIHEPTYYELLMDNMYTFTILFLLAFLLALASLYVVHYYAYRVHMPHLTMGTISLGAVTLVLIAGTAFMRGGAMLPTDVQFASVIQSL